MVKQVSRTSHIEWVCPGNFATVWTHQYEDPSKSLMRLKQTTTVTAYQEAFERFSHQVDSLPEGFLIGCFVSGLWDDIRINVKMKQPHILVNAIEVAWLIEEHNLLQKKASPSTYPSYTMLTPRAPINLAAGILGSPSSQRANSPLTSFRRITNQEARERQKKGLCYYYDEKFIPGYCCECSQLRMIEDSFHTSLGEGIDDS